MSITAAPAGNRAARTGDAVIVEDLVKTYPLDSARGRRAELLGRAG